MKVLLEQVFRNTAFGRIAVWRAEDLTLPCCVAEGVTPDEAVDNLYLARSDYYEQLAERGQPLPQKAEAAR